MFRNSKGLSRAAAAKEIDIHPSSVQYLESGLNEPRMSNYIKVVKWMGVQFEHYFN
jgi:DNA-binding XRE family transcriptional regulator